MPNPIDEYREKIKDTNIDSRSFLSTDYFNTFNSVVMMLDMLPDCPEMLEDIEQWKFMNYTEHFENSGLDFAKLAIEVYPYSPPELREAFEKKVGEIRANLENLIVALRNMLDAGNREAFGETVRTTAAQLRTMMEEGNGIVHGNRTVAQEDIDKLF